MANDVVNITDEVKHALCVPNVALKFTPETSGKKYEKQGIWILTKSGLKRYNVEIGASDDTKVQIISKEIKEKDKVVIGMTGQKKKAANAMRRPPL